MSPEEYLRFVQTVEHKWEYVDGTAYLMSGGTPTHAQLGAEAIFALRGALTDRPECRTYNSDLAVMAGQRFYYPDATVVCGEIDAPNQAAPIKNPALIVEVLSPSTQRVDRGEKLNAYLAIPSIRVVMLVSSTERLIECVRPDGSRSVHRPGDAPTVALPEFDIAIDIAAFYERVTLDSPNAGLE